MCALPRAPCANALLECEGNNLFLALFHPFGPCSSQMKRHRSVSLSSVLMSHEMYCPINLY